MAAVVAGVTIYLVFPTLIAVFGSWPKLKSLNPLWFLVALVAQVAHFTCTIALQRLALRTKAWFSVATSQLAGNAISLVVPGGQAAGAATQFRMLAASGSDPATAVGGLTAISILGIGGLLALPIFVLPAIIAGTPIDRGLEHAALLGIGAFFLFAGFSAVVLVVDAPMRWAGRVVQAVRNKVLRKRAPLTGLPERLVTERNRIRDVLGPRWKAALLLSSGRLAFDFMTLMACIWATGTKPAALARAAGLRRGGAARAHPDHAGRAGHRRGRAERHAHPGRYPGWRRGAGHPGLPDHLVLAARAGRAGGLRALPGALRAARSRAPAGAGDHGHGRGLRVAPEPGRRPCARPAARRVMLYAPGADAAKRAAVLRTRCSAPWLAPRRVRAHRCVDGRSHAKHNGYL